MCTLLAASGEMEHPARSPWRDLTAFVAGAGLGLALVVTGEYLSESMSSPRPLLPDEAWEFQPRPEDHSNAEDAVNSERLPELAASTPPVPASQRQVRAVSFLPLDRRLGEARASGSQQVNEGAPIAGAPNLDVRD